MNQSVHQIWVQRFGLNNPMFSDTSFKVGYKGTMMYANRIPLIETSPVFRRMFQDNDTQTVFEIPDVEPDIFLEMLKFIYHGTPDINQKNVIDLIIAADLYEIPKLETLCMVVDPYDEWW